MATAPVAPNVSILTAQFAPPKVEQIVRPYMIRKAMSDDRQYDVFHPSEWGYCQRKIAYRWYNQHKPFLRKAEHDVDLRIERVFDNGHSAHERWKKYLISSGLLRGIWICSLCDKAHGTTEKIGIFDPSACGNWRCECGSKRRLEYREILVRSEPEYNFEGHVDAVLDLRNSPLRQGNGNDVFVIDFKTIADEQFSALTRAIHEHAIQVQIYMWLLDLRAAVVIYENKDNQAVKEMFVPRDDNLINKVATDSKFLVRLLQYGKLPPRPAGFVRSNKPCRWCEFRDICFA